MRIVFVLALAMLPLPALAFCPALGTSDDAFWNCMDAEDAAKVREEALRQEMEQRLERLKSEKDGIPPAAAAWR